MNTNESIARKLADNTPDDKSLYEVLLLALNEAAQEQSDLRSIAERAIAELETCNDLLRNERRISESRQRDKTDILLWLKRHLETSVKHNAGPPVPNPKYDQGRPEGFTTVNIPEWEVRQKLDAMSPNEQKKEGG